jgi:hypothetical protein
MSLTDLVRIADLSYLPAEASRRSVGLRAIRRTYQTSWTFSIPIAATRAAGCEVSGFRPTRAAHDHRNDHRADGAIYRLRDNRYDRHAEPVHVRSLDREYVSSGPEVCSSRDLWH